MHNVTALDCNAGVLGSILHVTATFFASFFLIIDE